MTSLFFLWGSLTLTAQAADAPFVFDPKNLATIRFEGTLTIDFKGRNGVFWWCSRFNCEPVGKKTGYSSAQLNFQLQKLKTLDPVIRELLLVAMNPTQEPKMYFMFDKPYLQNGKKYLSALGAILTTCFEERHQAQEDMRRGNANFTCKITRGFARPMKIFETPPRIQEIRKLLLAALPN